ncbi:MAG TPA: hypothetical protein VEH48_01315 [Candidatus Nitrosopolaris sp.]|nr:hypothetical protein [Candidatus Nitrosopolaris sp.]
MGAEIPRENSSSSEDVQADAESSGANPGRGGEYDPAINPPDLSLLNEIRYAVEAQTESSSPIDRNRFWARRVVNYARELADAPGARITPDDMRLLTTLSYTNREESLRNLAAGLESDDLDFKSALEAILSAYETADTELKGIGDLRRFSLAFRRIGLMKNAGRLAEVQGLASKRS